MQYRERLEQLANELEHFLFVLEFFALLFLLRVLFRGLLARSARFERHLPPLLALANHQALLLKRHLLLLFGGRPALFRAFIALFLLWLL